MRARREPVHCAVVASTRSRRIAFYTRPAPRRLASSASADYGAGAEPDWREVDWPSHVHDTNLLGGRVRYLDIGTGAGTPIVLVHGLASCWQIWLETIPALSRHRRVVAVDLPGFGGSEMPVEPISITRYAHLVDALCDELGLGPVSLVGHSMGGFTGADLALQHPERVERLVLISAAGVSHNEVEPRLNAAMLTLIQAARPRGSQQRHVIKRPNLRHAAFAMLARHPLRIAPDLLYEQLIRFPGRGLLDAFTAITSYDFRGRLKDIACPTLIIHGRCDAIVPVADATEYEREIPNARKLLLDDTGHCPTLERPRWLNEELERFLELRAPARVRRRRRAVK